MSSDFENHRVLIASSHPLFAEGLKSLLEHRWGENLEIVGVVTSVAETIQELTTQKPDLIIVDYDDVHLNRDEFLQQFIKSTSKIRMVLLSLKDGAAGAEAIVYDRRTLAASKIEDWLEIDSTAGQPERGEEL
jgi:DNA-binding NarL/FixJ family response regulator